MKMLFIILMLSLTAITCNNSKDEKVIPSSEKKSIQDPVESKRVPEDIKDQSIADYGRYGIRSARVVTITAMPNGMGVSVATMFFDDYGKMSFTETVTKVSMKGVPAPAKQYSIKQGEFIYSWTDGKKTGTKMNLSAIKDIKNMDLEKLGKEMLEEMNMKKGGNETFLGKTCQVIEMNSDKLGKGKILTWKNIPMLSDMTTMGMKIRAEVTELEENISIDAAKFMLPADVEFKEFSVNM